MKQELPEGVPRQEHGNEYKGIFVCGIKKIDVRQEPESSLTTEPDIISHIPSAFPRYCRIRACGV